MARRPFTAWLNVGSVWGYFHTYFTGKSVMHDIAQVYGIRAETEFLDVGIFPFTDRLHMVPDSEIRDSMTVIAVLPAASITP